MRRLEETIKKRLRTLMRQVCDRDGHINYVMVEDMDMLVRRGEKSGYDMHGFRSAVNFYRDFGHIFRESETK